MLVWTASARPVRVVARRTLRAARGSWKSQRRLVHFTWSDIDASVSKAGTDELAWPSGRCEGSSLPWRSSAFRHTPPPPGRNWTCSRLQVLQCKTMSHMASTMKAREAPPVKRPSSHLVASRCLSLTTPLFEYSMRERGREKLGRPGVRYSAFSQLGGNWCKCLCHPPSSI